MNYRTGFGFDIHRLAENEELIIGGVKIQHSKGTVAHSDGDVLIHAICDALLGAAAEGDIGSHFPDTDPVYKGINSGVLLKKTIGIIKNKDYIISNIDTTVCLEKPKIKDFIPEIRLSLANIIDIGKDRISVKATTTEKLGSIGKEEAIAAYATTLIYKPN